ncbi:hypothetical protein Bpfe_029934 [Biomphalaria pfeifferi]|uniref:Uncharacterized protein n=1 Tax=Biomphalaria pfeifferi TaxID=112525 RepID=A0AAD8ATE8_BIOPF|nr:hypothetical protein Bpfe_029934 [Biomphalaria pfeifferi]
MVRDASHLTVEEVLVLWGRAAIPTVLKKHAIEKLEKIHDKWLKLKKNKTRLSETQQKIEACYTEQLHTLFNIASVNALDKNSPNPLQQTRIEEDRAFLTDQRGCRKMFMTGEDKEMAAQQERVHDKQQKQLLCKENEEKRQQQTMEGESGENESEAVNHPINLKF